MNIAQEKPALMTTLTPVIQQNIETLANTKRPLAGPSIVKKKDEFAWIKPNTESYKVIRFMQKNGRSTSNEIRKGAKIAKVPYYFINNHIAKGQVLQEKVPGGNHIYQINPDLPDDYFVETKR